MKNLLVVAVIAGAWIMYGARGDAQTPQSQENNPHVISNQDMDLLRKDIRSRKKHLWIDVDIAS